MTYRERDKTLGLGEHLEADETALRLARVRNVIDSVMKIVSEGRVGMSSCELVAQKDKWVIRYDTVEGVYLGFSVPVELLPDDWEAAVAWVMEGLDENTYIQLTGKASPEKVIEMIKTANAPSIPL